jgi:hypothetical protein
MTNTIRMNTKDSKLIKLLFLALLGLSSSLSVGQALVNNPCALPAGAQWPVDGSCNAYTTAGMGALYNPYSCNSDYLDDGWAWFVGDGNQITVTLTTTAGRDPVLHVFSHTAPCSVVEIGCSDDFGNGGTETVIFNSVLGTNYLVRVQRWNSNNNAVGTLCITSTIISGSGDDCADAIAVTCGDPALVGETTVGNGNTEGNWACIAPITTPGTDRFYAVTVTGASNSEIRLYLNNVVDASSSQLEVMFLGTSCAPNACSVSNQFTISTGLFLGGQGFFEATIPGPGTYYFVVDDQGDGIDSYDISWACFDSGIELDVVNSCPPIPGTANANQGIYATWNGGAPPATIDASTMSGVYTICENVYIANPNGWQWLMNFEIVLGACWINVDALGNFTPDLPGSNAFYPSPNGDWDGMFIAGGANSDTIRWGNFVHGSDPTWGDGDAGYYSCYLYTFCFDANADNTCAEPTGFENELQAQDDGVGGSGGSSSPSTVSIVADDPVINNLPIELVNFTAKLIEGIDGSYAVQVDWATATEIDNRYFTIERSQDLELWEEVFRMDGAGTSSQTNRYVGFDPSPLPGTTYYRLVQTDFNNDFERFAVVAVDFDHPTVDLTVYPVPASTQVVFEVVSPKGEFATIEVADVSGRIVQSVVLEAEYAVTKMKHDISAYKPGLYFVTVRVEGQEAVVEKMIVE